MNHENIVFFICLQTSVSKLKYISVELSDKSLGF